MTKIHVEFARREIQRWRQARAQFKQIGHELTPDTFMNRKVKTRLKRSNSTTTTTSTRNKKGGRPHKRAARSQSRKNKKDNHDDDNANANAGEIVEEDVGSDDDDNDNEDEDDDDDTVHAVAYPLTVQNAVFTAALGTKVDFQQVVRVFYGVLGKKTFPAVICRFLYPEAVVSFFESGRVVITGSRHPYDVVALLWMIALRFQTHLGIRCGVHDILINNVNCSASVGYELDLELFHVDHVNITSYAPDVFPGLKFPVNDIVIQKRFHGVTFLLFRSGRMVVTGAKVPSDAQAAFASMKHLLANYNASNPYRRLDTDVRDQVARRKPT